MVSARIERRLSAIMSADVVGYSRMMGDDEDGTLRRVKTLHHEIIAPCVRGKHGRIVKTTGDGFLVEFGSVFDAFHCAVAIQQKLHEHNRVAQRPDRLSLRIGINVGDVIHDEGDLFGDGVNVASRLEPLAPADGICISKRAWDDLRRLGLPFRDMGEQTLKNIRDPVRVYCLEVSQIAQIPPEMDFDDTPAAASHSRRRRWLAGLAAVGIVAAGVGGWLTVGGRPAAAVQPYVRLGSFAAISPQVPTGIAPALRQELMAAFSIENTVTVVTDAGASKAVAAPFRIDGSIRQVDPLLRFTMNFKNDQTGVLLWSQTFDSPIVAERLAPRQVAVSASQIVRCALWGAAAHSTVLSDRALSLYLQFCNEFWGGSSTDEKMLDAARRVTDAAPGFSFGWSARALTALPLAQRAEADVRTEYRKEAADAARRAIEIDARNPEGYMVQAGLLPPRAFAQREALLKRAISVRPTECGCERQLYGDFLLSVGRLEDAAEEFQRGHDKQPLAPRSNVRLIHALYSLGRIDEADRRLDEILLVWPYAASLQVMKIKSAFWTRRYEDALRRLDDPALHLRTSSRDALIATFVALQTRDPQKRSSAIKLLIGLSDDQRTNDRLIVASLAALGSREDAIRAAGKLIRQNSIWFADVLFEPNLAGASRDPAFGRLVEDIGLTAYWRSARQAPDICRQPQAPALCGTI